MIRVRARTKLAAQLLVFSTSGSIEIGNDHAINSGDRIWSSRHVRIGDRVLISHDVFISDNNGYPYLRRDGRSALERFCQGS